MSKSDTELPETKSLKLSRESGVLHILLDQPETRNALTEQLTGELSAVLDAVAGDRKIRTLVLRGAGGIFSAGGDIKGFKAMTREGIERDAVAASNRSFGALLLKLNKQPQTVVVLVEGAAIGGGLGLACVGDITIVTADTKFRLSETSLGIPPAQIAPFVRERVGLAIARRLMLTGASFTGVEAGKWGLAHFVVPDTQALERQCAVILEQINTCAPAANAASKQILFKSLETTREQTLDFAADAFADCLLSDEGREGVAAFMEKRRPAWCEKDG